MKQHGRIILLGMKHTGKSTLGKLLAKKLLYPFYDTDAVILQLSGKSPRELHEAGGAALLSQWETTSCRYLADLDNGDKSVIATGGGIADNAEALKICEGIGLCVYVDTPFDILFARITESANRDGSFPPFLRGADPRSQFLEIFERRSRVYAEHADVHIQAGTKTPLEVAQEITDYIAYGQSTNPHGKR